jgi:hypothetical protein
MKNLFLFMFLCFMAGVIFCADIDFNKTSCEIPENRGYSICILNNTGESLSSAGHMEEWILFSDGSTGSPILYGTWKNKEYIVISLANNFFEVPLPDNTSTPKTIYYSINERTNGNERVVCQFGWFKHSPPYPKTPILVLTKKNGKTECGYLKHSLKSALP